MRAATTGGEKENDLHGFGRQKQKKKQKKSEKEFHTLPRKLQPTKRSKICGKLNQMIFISFSRQ